MPITEKLMSQGQVIVTLDLSLVPNYILNAIQPWDQIVVTDSEMESAEWIDSVMLPSSEYVGVIQSLSIDPETAEIEGVGMSVYLGDSDNKGLGVSEIQNDGSKSRVYENNTIEYVINNDDGQPYGLLRNNDSGRLRSVWPGTITEKTIQDTDLLLNFEGTDGDTTYTDETDLEHKTTFYDTAQISDDQAKWGNTSLYLDGDGYILVDYHPGFHPANNDFTMEWWEYRLTP